MNDHPCIEMTQPKHPAFPMVDQDGPVNYGLSKREWLTGQALAGLAGAIYTQDCGLREIAQMAVDLADSTIDSLNEQEPNGHN